MSVRTRRSVVPTETSPSSSTAINRRLPTRISGINRMFVKVLRNQTEAEQVAEVPENNVTPNKVTTPIKKSTRLQRKNDDVDSVQVPDLVGKKERNMSPSSGSNASNVENMDEQQNQNEQTPRRSKLSRGRTRSGVQSTPLQEKAVLSMTKVMHKYQASPKEGKDLSIVLRRVTSDVKTPISTPSRKLPAREARSRSLKTSFYFISEDEASDNDTPAPKQRTRKPTGTYFTKEDYETYAPTDEDDGDASFEVIRRPRNKQEVPQSIHNVSESESEEEEESEESGSESEEDSVTDNDNDDEPTLKKTLATPMRSHDMTRLAGTPDLIKKIEGRAVKRMAVDSPVTLGSLTMSPNPESYFLAENRLKFRKRAKVEHVMNDAMKGKRRRKKRPTRTAEELLPESELPPNFSVTAEAMKAVQGADFVPGSTHDTEVARLLKETVVNQFPNWIGLFRESFNVMIYGYGSKLSIFREFEKYVGDEYLVVRVNGLFPKLNARKFLYGVCENIVSEERVPHGTNLEGVAKEIVSLLSADEYPDVFILVNNFDNLAFRQPQMLSMLCWLSQVPCIHILASCDTLNAFLGVTQSQALRLKFCWMHCPTYKPYRDELKWIPGVYGGETKSTTQKSSLKYVLQSLTGNARKAFAILCQMQLKQMKAHATGRSSKVPYAGVRFQELAKECREKFIAHTDDNLRTLLVEFFDHKLIRQSGKGKHVENMLLIEFDVETLEEIIPDLV